MESPERQEQLLKSVGLLNTIGAHGGLKASKQLVALCADVSAIAAARQLMAKSA